MDVVVDNNVVVSGLLFKGLPGRIVSLWKQRDIIPYVTREIVDEYIRVLTYPKFQLSGLEIEYLVYQEILPYVEIVKPLTRVHVVHDDPADDMFLHCALAGQVKTIISGDKHLLDVQAYKSISILDPADFLQKFSG